MLPAKGFQLIYQLKLNGISQNEYARFDWEAKLKRIEQGMDQSRQYTTINYYTDEKDFKDLSASSHMFERYA